MNKRLALGIAMVVVPVIAWIVVGCWQMGWDMVELLAAIATAISIVIGLNLLDG